MIVNINTYEFHIGFLALDRINKIITYNHIIKIIYAKGL